MGVPGVTLLTDGRTATFHVLQARPIFNLVQNAWKRANLGWTTVVQWLQARAEPNAKFGRLNPFIWLKKGGVATPIASVVNHRSNQNHGATFFLLDGSIVPFLRARTLRMEPEAMATSGDGWISSITWEQRKKWAPVPLQQQWQKPRQAQPSNSQTKVMNLAFIALLKTCVCQIA